MVAARRQKQAQKLQEQQMSKALAEPKASTSHVSFDDDDDDAADSVQGTATASTSNIAQSNAGASQEDDDDDDELIEMVSTKTTRKQASQELAKLKAQEKAEKAKRQAAAEKKKLEKQKEKEAAKALEAAEVAAEEVENDTATSSNDGEQSGSEDEAGSSNRLDPSLFAEVFAQPVSAPRSILKKRSAEERADEVAKLQRERKQRRKEQRAGGVVKGRDGQPMKRLEDGTVLRALSTSKSHKTSFGDEDEDEPEKPLDEVVRPTPLDSSASLPNAKARAFKKRSLLKKGSSSKAAPAKGSAKTKKDEDDPLGLNDPAFLPGGEFYHLVNKSGKVKGPKQGSKEAPASARQAFRGGGVRKDAVSVLRARSRGGPSLGFARSQEDSDDGY